MVDGRLVEDVTKNMWMSKLTTMFCKTFEKIASCFWRHPRKHESATSTTAYGLTMVKF